MDSENFFDVSRELSASDYVCIVFVFIPNNYQGSFFSFVCKRYVRILLVFSLMMIIPISSIVHTLAIFLSR